MTSQWAWNPNGEGPQNRSTYPAHPLVHPTQSVNSIPQVNQYSAPSAFDLPAQPVQQPTPSAFDIATAHTSKPQPQSVPWASGAVPRVPTEPAQGNWKGSIGGMTPSTGWQGGNLGDGGNGLGDIADEEQECIMDELGIYPEQILKRLKGVLFFRALNEEYLRECDMVGPAAVLALLAVALLASGRMLLSHMYSLGIGGSFGMYILLNLMSQRSAIDLYTTISILGYSLLPIDIMAICRIFFTLRGSWWGVGLCVLLVAWATATSSRFFETVLKMESQRFLVAYPLFLFYSAFVLLVVL